MERWCCCAPAFVNVFLGFHFWPVATIPPPTPHPRKQEHKVRKTTNVTWFHSYFISQLCLSCRWQKANRQIGWSIVLFESHLDATNVLFFSPHTKRFVLVNSTVGLRWTGRLWSARLRQLANNLRTVPSQQNPLSVPNKTRCTSRMGSRFVSFGSDLDLRFGYCHLSLVQHARYDCTLV